MKSLPSELIELYLVELLINYDVAPKQNTFNENKKFFYSRDKKSFYNFFVQRCFFTFIAY
jgi:hypothetical protein